MGYHPHFQLKLNVFIRSMGFCLVALGLGTNTAFAESSLIWKTETEFAESFDRTEVCQTGEDCSDNHFVDYEYLSHYGRKIFVSYAEGTRVYLGFDVPLHSNWEAQSQFNLGQMAHGAYDWGGVMENGKFKPLYVIKRVYDPGFDYSADSPDKTKTGLYVWKLGNPAGKIISETIGMAGAENSNARALAENDYAKLQAIEN